MHTPSVILLPGSLCDRRLWQYQLAHLEVHAAVEVGDLTRDESIAAMARRLLERAPPRFALAGLSLGGIVALEVMRQAPERVRGLALLSTNARPSSPEQRAQWREIAAKVRGGRLREVVCDTLLPALVHPDRRADAKLARVVEEMAAAVGPEAYLCQLAALATRADSRPWLARIACPTLVVAGRADAICPLALHNEMAAAIPGARLAVVERCGHLSSLEQPQAISALLRDWLHGLSDPHSRAIASDEAR
jgi:pimeloyl-ACP methyl ester carboxylesterase